MWTTTHQWPVTVKVFHSIFESHEPRLMWPVNSCDTVRLYRRVSESYEGMHTLLLNSLVTKTKVVNISLCEENDQCKIMPLEWAFEFSLYSTMILKNSKQSHYWDLRGWNCGYEKEWHFRKEILGLNN